MPKTKQEKNVSKFSVALGTKTNDKHYAWIKLSTNFRLGIVSTKYVSR